MLNAEVSSVWRSVIGDLDHDEYCRGIVTADVLLQGLDHGAIATRKLKGVNRDKGHEKFILVQPLTVKEGLRLVGFGIA